MLKRLSAALSATALLTTLLLGWLITASPVLADTGNGTTTSTGTGRKNSLNPLLTVTQAGDYSAHGVGMRGAGAGTITVADIPAGSTVTTAFLYWAVLDNGPNPAFANGVFNGTPISGVSTGTDADPCWPVTMAFGFRANVTSLVLPGGNGGYLLSGFGLGSPTALNEGATLVILYTDPAAVEKRDIVIYDGADTINETVSSVTTTMTIPAVGIPGNPKTSYIVADGQEPGSDETLFDGNVIDADAFQGSDGPLWDTDTYEAQIAPYVSPGETSITVGLRQGPGTADCLTYIAQVFSASSQSVLPFSVTLNPLAATNPVDSNHTVTATVRGFAGQPAPGETVVFQISGSTNLTLTCTTNASGQCSITYQGPPLPGADNIHAFVDENGNGSQDPGEPFSVPDARKVWVLPVTTPGCEIRITNGGWIIAANGDRGSFGGNAKADGESNVTGNEEYQDHGPLTPFNLHGDVLVIVCGNDNKSGTVFGEATVDGSGDHVYRIDVVDNEEPGKGADTYRIRFNTPFVYDSGNQVLRGGNIQVHRET